MNLFLSAFVWPGKSVVEEMILLHEAGLSNYEALKTSTTNASLYITGTEKNSQLIVGAPANMVLLNENPLSDLENLRLVVGVFAKGNWYSRERLDEMIAKLINDFN